MSEQNGKPGDKTYDVFISHKSDCKPWVRVLAQNLKNQNYKIFLDEWELVPGKSIVNGLYQGLNQSQKGILAATPEAFESGWVKEEYQQMMIQKQEDKDFFAQLRKQCGFSQAVNGSVKLGTLFVERLNEGGMMFLMVSGFENSCQVGQHILG